ncbi:MAG TPA: arylsulfatase [Verrucomicrobiales bacterium]|nr:arylsulfatase [Verrucomicrobiales bacterium]
MKHFFISFLALFPFCLSAQETPNLVLLFIDDMGYGDIGPFGSKLNRTPNLDRMAKEGRKLTSFYAAPVCSASRAQLMTGCYAPRVGVPGVFFPAGRNGLNPEEHTIADYLKELGYATMCVGKWHLGDQREFLPTRHGFDGYFGIPYSNDMGRTATANGKRVHPLMRDEKVAELLEDEGQRRVTREYTEEAVKFMEASRKQGRNFFLYLPHTAMHVPLYPHPDFAGKSRNGTYGDWVEEVDWSVGQVLNALERLKVAKNTLVLFTSDNGPWASKGKAGGVSGPLRGSKGCTLEGGVREPTIVWWPGTIAPGTESAGIAGTTDVLPTFVSLAGGKVKKDIKIDGIDVSAWMLGKTNTSPRDTWHYFQGSKLQAVRQGPWKLALTAQSLGMGIRQRDADLAKGRRLYNLKTEIGEMTDLAEENPAIVEKLEKIAVQITAEISANKRPAGTVPNPVTLYPATSRRQPAKKTREQIKPVNWDKMKMGDTYDSSRLPDMAGKPFSIQAAVKIESGQKPNGVILAHGGSAVGYVLYAKDDRLVFSVRGGTPVVQKVTFVSPGENMEILASLSPEKLSIQVGGKSVEVKSPGLLSRHPQESLCIGHDDANPVDPGAPKGRINGSLSTLKVTIR